MRVGEGARDDSRGVALVIDRDVRAGSTIARHLCERGYRPVHHVADIGVAEKLIDSSLAVVVVDLDCGDGRRALDLIAALAAHRDAPRIVATTSPSEGTTIAEALKLGAQAFVPYPVSADELLARLGDTDRPSVAVRRLARSIVGRVGVLQAMAMLRGEMVNLGMERENHSRRATAKLLQVDRKVVQRVIAEQRLTGQRPRTQSGTRRIET